MFALLSPKLWIAAAIAIALAASHFYAYRGGRHAVQTQWDIARAEATNESRKMEQLRQSHVDAATVAGAKRQSAITADAASARNQRDGLRNERDAIRLHAAQSLAAATVTVAAYADVFEQCVREYSSVAEAADRAIADALMLEQAWPK